jgi:hypothetical protein
MQKIVDIEEVMPLRLYRFLYCNRKNFDLTDYIYIFFFLHYQEVPPLLIAFHQIIWKNICAKKPYI